MENEQPLSLFGLSIDEENTGTLRSASQWGKVLAVLGFVLGAMVILLGIILYNKIAGSYSPGDYAARSLKTIALRYLVISVLFGGVFITGAIFTMNFSNRVITALNTHDQYSLNSGLSAIKSGIIFWTIMFVLFILLLILAFIGIASI